MSMSLVDVVLPLADCAPVSDRPTTPERSTAPTTVADRLYALRRRFGWSVSLAASELGISEMHLDQLEIGLREPSSELIAVVASVYGVDRERLEADSWAERVPARYDEATSTLWLGWLAVQVERERNEQSLCAIGAQLRTMRGVDEAAPLPLRHDELALVGSLLDLNDPGLGGLIEHYLKLDHDEAAQMVSLMWANRPS